MCKNVSETDIWYSETKLYSVNFIQKYIFLWNWAPIFRRLRMNCHWWTTTKGVVDKKLKAIYIIFILHKSIVFPSNIVNTNNCLCKLLPVMHSYFVCQRYRNPVQAQPLVVQTLCLCIFICIFYIYLWLLDQFWSTWVTVRSNFFVKEAITFL